MEDRKAKINQAWENRTLLQQKAYVQAIEDTLELTDKGKLRVAEQISNEWIVNDWVKKAVILYFIVRKMTVSEVGIFEFHDKIPLKRQYAEQGIRVFPHAVARYGAYIAPNVILMPSHVNIGAYVDTGTMVDTWATVG